MRPRMVVVSAAVVLAMTYSAPIGAATVSGTVMMGGVAVDETGDRSAVQETYDLQRGFALSKIQLLSTFGPRNTLALDLRDLNLRSRAGQLVYRAPGRLKLTAGYDQNRLVFDPGRGVTSERRDWRAGAHLTPARWLSLSGDFNHQTREGERLAFPLGTASALGDRYDNTLMSGQLVADIRSGRRGGGLSLRMSDYSDDLRPGADRSGMIVAGRLYAPMPFWSRWTNLFRASYGTRRLTDGDLEHTLSSFRYTAVVQPRGDYELRYAFDASRVDDDAADLQTDRLQNDFDVAWLHRHGRVTAGYGYELNDDDRTLTHAHGWRVGATLRPDPRISARADYSGRNKKDEEELTLLKDIESSRVRASLEVRPVDRLTLGGDFARRERELPDIGVSVDGVTAGALLRYEVAGWGALSADYSRAVEEFVDLVGGFETASDVVTARADVERIAHLRLGGGVTYLSVERDLDIEKSMVFVEASLRLAGRYRLDVRYNVFNYDDYVLLDRYYTANVVRVDLGYELRP
jgi:hypothetical protein